MLCVLLASLARAQTASPPLSPTIPDPVLCSVPTSTRNPFTASTVPTFCPAYSTTETPAAIPGPTPIPSLTPAERTQALANAHRFAPILFFHPLETYPPTDIDDWLATASFFDTSRNLLYPFSDSTLNSTVNSGDSGKYTYLAQTNSSKWVGVGFDARGHSLARTYFNLVPGPQGLSWIYNFFFFFGKTGCSNQDILLTERDVDYVMSYQACNKGVREGDWQQVGVEVCSDLRTVLRVTFSQYDFNQEKSCVHGECQLQGTHPVGYVALGSHSIHSHTSHAIVYSQLRNPTDSLRQSVVALSLVDRVLVDSENPRKFVPSPSNVVPIGESDAPMWTRYTGHFGASFFDEIAENIAQIVPICLTEDGLSLVSCNQTNVAYTADITIQNAIEKYQAFAEYIDMTHSGPDGPWMHPTRWSQWYARTLSPQEELDIPVLCTDSETIFYLTRKIKTSSSVNPALTATVGTIGFAVLLAYLFHVLRKHYQRHQSAKNPLKALGKGRMRTAADLTAVLDNVPVLSIVAAFLNIIGNLAEWIGILNMIYTVQVYLPSLTWYSLQMFFNVMSPISIIFSIFIVIYALGRRGHHVEVLLLLPILRNIAARVNGPNFTNRVVMWMFFSIILSAVLGVMCFCIGSVMLFFKVTFTKACKSGRVESSSCLSLDDFGLNSVYCDSSLDQLCIDMTGLDVSPVIIGSVFVLTAQLLFMWTAGSRIMSGRNILGKRLRVKGKKQHALEPGALPIDIEDMEEAQLSRRPNVQGVVKGNTKHWVRGSTVGPIAPTIVSPDTLPASMPQALSTGTPSSSAPNTPATMPRPLSVATPTLIDNAVVLPPTVPPPSAPGSLRSTLPPQEPPPTPPTGTPRTNSRAVSVGASHADSLR